MDHIINSFVGISKGFKSTNMFINGSFSNIASTRKWYFEASKSFEEGREKKYSNTDFFDEFRIEIIKAHIGTIQSESISYEFYSYVQ